MRFLITGGAGFLGTALSNRLASLGHHVTVLDDCSAGDPPTFCLMHNRQVSKTLL